MKYIFSSFKESIGYLIKDKPTLLLSLIPPTIGLVLFSFFGRLIFTFADQRSRLLIDTYFQNEWSKSFFSYFFYSIIFIVVLFLVNYTFVVIVSIIASPFNDAISSRIEKLAGGQEPESLKESISQMMKNGLKMIVTELKKFGFIIFLTALSFLFSIIPLLLPLSIFLSAFLVSVGFLDYSWSRHNLSFGNCLKESLRKCIPYWIGGAFFMAIITIPIINLIALPLGVVYFTTLRVRLLTETK